MKKLIVIAIAGIIAGWAGLASANSDSQDHRRVVIRNRVVQMQMDTERPYALTGKRQAAEEGAGYAVQSRGRSGFVRARVY